MMKSYRVSSAYDPDAEYGTLTTEDDRVSGFEPSDGDSFGLIEKMTMGRLIDQARAILKTFNIEEIENPQEDAGEPGEEDLPTAGDIIKIDPDKRLVFGWAYVTHDKDGQQVIDKSGDFVENVDEIEKAAYDYVLKSRQGDVNHTNVKTSDLVESIVFTPEKLEKMGIAPGSVPSGWWIGFKVHDDAVWEDVKSGKLAMFSVHGSGTRIPVTE